MSFSKIITNNGDFKLHVVGEKMLIPSGHYYLFFAILCLINAHNHTDTPLFDRT